MNSLIQALLTTKRRQRVVLLSATPVGCIPKTLPAPQVAQWWIRVALYRQAMCLSACDTSVDPHRDIWKMIPAGCISGVGRSCRSHVLARRNSATSWRETSRSIVCAKNGSENAPPAISATRSIKCSEPRVAARGVVTALRNVLTPARSSARMDAAV